MKFNSNTQQVFNRMVDVLKQKLYINMYFNSDKIELKYNDFLHFVENNYFKESGSFTYENISDLKKRFNEDDHYISFVNKIDEEINNFALEIIYTYRDYLFAYNQSPNEFYRITEKLSSECIKVSLNENKMIVTLKISCLDHFNVIQKGYETISSPDDFFESRDYVDLHKEAVTKISEKIYRLLKPFK